MPGGSAGMVLRDWRVRRRRSQMDLANEVGVSPRHLSFVETGRSKASPELLMILAEHLDIPLRERNGLLMASGYAPRYPHTSLDSSDMARIRRTLQRVLKSHDPYPGVVIDRYWNVVLANEGAMAIVAGLPGHVVRPPMNVFHVSLHPDGLARQTLNLEEWSAHLLGQLHRSTVVTGDAELERRVRHRLRTVARCGRSAGRRSWVPSPVPPRDGRIHADLIGLWGCPEHRRPCRGTRAAGCGIGPHAPPGALDNSGDGPAVKVLDRLSTSSDAGLQDIL